MPAIAARTCGSTSDGEVFNGAAWGLSRRPSARVSVALAGGRRPGPSDRCKERHRGSAGQPRSANTGGGGMKRQLRGVATAAALLLGLGAGNAALAEKAGGTLKVSHFDSPASMSIHEEATVAALRPAMAVFNNLVMYRQDVAQTSLQSIVPDLATGWSWNEEGTELTFPLRQGVKWHDGKPFTAWDVKCTWDLLTGKASEKLRINPRKPWYTNLAEVTAKGDFEVTFHLKRPQPSFLVLLASGWSPIYPCHVPARDMRQHPIGT